MDVDLNNEALNEPVMFFIGHGCWFNGETFNTSELAKFPLNMDADFTNEALNDSVKLIEHGCWLIAHASLSKFTL